MTAPHPPSPSPASGKSSASDTPSARGVPPTPPTRSTPPSLAWPAAAVRGWTRLYTARLTPALRDARRAEIESDLWESLHDPEAPRGAAGGLQMLARLVAGMPHDLAWRAEQAVTGRDPRAARTLAASAAIVTLLAAMSWVLPALMPGTLPTPPGPPVAARRVMPPPPPPPPPPPAPRCRPPALTEGCAS